MTPSKYLQGCIDDNKMKVNLINITRDLIIKEMQMITKFKFELYVTGSRGSSIAYPDSDVDMAFVVDSSSMIDNIWKTFIGIIGSSSKIFEGCDFPIGVDSFTDTGLRWIPIHNMRFGKQLSFISKLDLVFRTKKRHYLIETKYKAEIDKMDDTDKVFYIGFLESCNRGMKKSIRGNNVSAITSRYLSMKIKADAFTILDD